MLGSEQCKASLSFSSPPLSLSMFMHVSVLSVCLELFSIPIILVSQLNYIRYDFLMVISLCHSISFSLVFLNSVAAIQRKKNSIFASTYFTLSLLIWMKVSDGSEFQTLILAICHEFGSVLSLVCDTWTIQLLDDNGKSFMRILHLIWHGLGELEMLTL